MNLFFTPGLVIRSFLHCLLIQNTLDCPYLQKMKKPHYGEAGCGPLQACLVFTLNISYPMCMERCKSWRNWASQTVFEVPRAYLTAGVSFLNSQETQRAKWKKREGQVSPDCGLYCFCLFPGDGHCNQLLSLSYYLVVQPTQANVLGTGKEGAWKREYLSMKSTSLQCFGFEWSMPFRLTFSSESVRWLVRDLMMTRHF